ncbi:hypothetical protein ASG89_06925 [Paenibacillus sp. Soil766]|uniref:hypothetical protein n=1 Tax=Paenibacillus sp. Soil766 TaxID=1736404 RepID=UPI00070E7C5F|nr:hypothetical protein [Paenibacillus sp. Soil766]KRE93230.1 hypothetical protein ASG89_06925 [Paenibacillus sp. Soil766]
MVRRVLSLILMTVLGFSFMTIFHSSNAYACSCAMPQTVEAQFNRSEAVFAGRVLDVNEQRNLNGSMTKAALFDVSHIWKGGTASQIIIHTGSGGGDCGFNFEKGKEYLVYAGYSTMYGDKKLLVTIICDRTVALDQAQEDLAALGEGKPPTDKVNLEGELSRLHPYIWVAIIGFVLLGTTIFLVRRKWRK